MLFNWINSLKLTNVGKLKVSQLVQSETHSRLETIQGEFSICSAEEAV